jgi:hypothetical protein
MLRDLLRHEGRAVGRRQEATLMRRMGLEGDIGGSDLIPMRRGFLYLFAVGLLKAQGIQRDMIPSCVWHRAES